MTTHTRSTLPRRVVVLTTTLLTALTVVSCSDDPPSSSAGPSPVAGSSSGSSGSVLSPLSEPGDTVTDIAGPTDEDISFVAPDGAEEIDDGLGKRAFTVDDGQLMVGLVRAYYTVAADGLLEAREPGGDPAIALAAFRSRPDLKLLAQGQLDVAGESALMVAFRTKPSAPEPISDLWCFQDETPCYKMPTELRAQQVVIPWGDRLLVVHSEWAGTSHPPAGLASARDQLLQSLERTA